MRFTQHTPQACHKPTRLQFHAGVCLKSVWRKLWVIDVNKFAGCPNRTCGLTEGGKYPKQIPNRFYSRNTKRFGWFACSSVGLDRLQSQRSRKRWFAVCGRLLPDMRWPVQDSSRLLQTSNDPRTHGHQDHEALYDWTTHCDRPRPLDCQPLYSSTFNHACHTHMQLSCRSLVCCKCVWKQRNIPLCCMNCFAAGRTLNLNKFTQWFKNDINVRCHLHIAWLIKQHVRLIRIWLDVQISSVCQKVIEYLAALSKFMLWAAASI